MKSLTVESNHDNKLHGVVKRMEDKDLSSTWKQITDFKGFRKEVQEVAMKGIRVKIGDENKTSFWFDLWSGDENLKTRFPRLFMLSTQKHELVKDMGRWENMVLSWTFQWRRTLFAWEEELLGDLFYCCESLKVEGKHEGCESLVE